MAACDEFPSDAASVANANAFCPRGPCAPGNLRGNPRRNQPPPIALTRAGLDGVRLGFQHERNNSDHLTDSFR